jgi:hypothetical protein
MRSTQSKDVARAAILMALTGEREEENRLQEELATRNVRAAAADYGGEFLPAIQRIVERAVVAAKREGVIKPIHADLCLSALDQLINDNHAVGHIAFACLYIAGKQGGAQQAFAEAVLLCFKDQVGVLADPQLQIGVGHLIIDRLKLDDVDAMGSERALRPRGRFVVIGQSTLCEVGILGIGGAKVLLHRRVRELTALGIIKPEAVIYPQVSLTFEYFGLLEEQKELVIAITPKNAHHVLLYALFRILRDHGHLCGKVRGHEGAGVIDVA